MDAPQFKGKNTGIYGKIIPFHEIGQINKLSLVGLYFSEFLLYLGFVLILLNNMNIIAPGSFFGAFNWVTVVVFFIGLTINFISIPYLYFSSFRNFKKENDFWDKETFWILPLFFFGTFFVYCSQISSAFCFFIISIVIISIIHLKFVHISWKLIKRDSGKTLANYYQYNTSLKYLTAYYMILLALLVFCNPLQQVFIWIRVHI